jgi:hypothetical protein
LKKEKANFVFCGSPSEARRVARMNWLFVRLEAREIQHAKRSAFFVGITTLSERTIWFQATTHSAREIIVCFENRFGFGKIEAPIQNSKVFWS